MLEEVARDEAEEPSPHKDLEDRTIYLPRNDFGDPESGPGKPVLTDFNIAVFGDDSHPLLHSIQPDSYRAPEVTLGAPWSYSADIWNVGIMVNYRLFITAQRLVPDALTDVGFIRGEVIMRSSRSRIWSTHGSCSSVTAHWTTRITT